MRGRPTKNPKVCAVILPKQRSQVHTMLLNQLNQVNFLVVRTVKVLVPIPSNVLIVLAMQIKWWFLYEMQYWAAMS